MTYTREEWSRSLLVEIGNTNPTLQTIEWLVSWTKIETNNPPGASYNLLNTTENNTPGVESNFNSAGVKNYDTFSHGIQANGKVLQNGLYNQLLEALRTNSISTLTNGNDINKELSIWGTGSVQQIINNNMGLDLKDYFPGNEGVLTMNFQIEFKAFLPNVDDTLGIGKSWYEDRANGIDHGPALTHEYYDDNYAYQNFAGALAMWEKATGKITWFKYS